MLLAQVAAVLDDLDVTDVAWWLAGGWGVDALHGRQTREHRDLDLLVDARHLDTCLSVLARRGYAVETDWLPVRVEVSLPGVGWVDLHPVVLDADGHGVQAGPDGTTFEYPPDCFTVGSLDGRPVPCIGVLRQVEAHTGYPPRHQDLHDLELLRELRDHPADRSG